MEREWTQLLQESAFEELLARTDEVLSITPNDSLALTFRGRALASLLRYDEACQSLEKALRYSTYITLWSAITQLLYICSAIANIERTYEIYSHENETWDIDWYNNTLREVIRLSQEAARTHSLEKFWRKKTLQAASVYILGPAQRVDNFHAVELGVVQCLREPLPRFPAAQADGAGHMYLRHQTYLCPFGLPKRWRRCRKDGPEPVARFPTAKWESKGQVIKPTSKCDVLYSTDSVESAISRLLRWSLDSLGAERQDFFVPQYHNIIDPNLTALLDSSRNVYRWTATDFLIKEERVPRKTIVFCLQGCIRHWIGRGLPWQSIQLILNYSGQTLPFARAHLASPLPLLPLEKHRELAVVVESILTAALPLVAELRRPALLLPGKLQAVVKAQRIYLNPGEEYEGVWHCDGLNEDIVAVVLYYYRFSAQLEGGDLEFMSRKPRNQVFWLHGDCNPDSFGQRDLEEFLGKLLHARVPIKEDTLVVFSNYQLVHRVLRMANHSDQVASRDFLVFFLVDQRSPLLSTQHLPQSLDKQASKLIREQLFFEQLKPSGQFGAYGGLVYSTGNGSCALLGWMEKNDEEANTSHSAKPRPALLNLKLLSQCPPLHRGISWVLDPELLESEECKLMQFRAFLDKCDTDIQTFLTKWTNLHDYVNFTNWTLNCTARRQLQKVISQTSSLLQIVKKAKEGLEASPDLVTCIEIQNKLGDLLRQATEQLEE